MFARHGVPETLITDDGPQFSGSAFSALAATYGFSHVTSSPRFPQSNGEAERAVQTVKNPKELYLALLAYRATPLQNGLSPAQLLMGRQLRTILPVLPSLRQLSLPNSAVVSEREKERRNANPKRFNQRHRAPEVNRLPPAQEVWVTDSKVTGSRGW